MKKIEYADAAVDVIYTLLTAVVIPGLIFWIVGHTWFIDRATFNIDYLLVCLVLVPLGVAPVVAGLAIILIIDIIFSFAPAYHFSLTSVLDSISDLFSLEPGYLLAETGKVLFIVLLATAFMFLSIRRTRSTRIVMATCLVTAILLTLLDMRYSANAIRERDSYNLNVNIAASSLNNLRLAMKTAAQSPQDQHFQTTESAGQVLKESLKNTGKQFQTLILINVESLGELTSHELQSFQMEPIMALRNRNGIELKTGVVKFEGSTVPGELRELCGIRLLAVHPDIAILPTDDCLPAVLGLEGYETWAIHGFIGTLFSRNLWYPALKFDNIWFAPDLDEQIDEANRCGIAFHGICDSDIWKMMMQLHSNAPGTRKFIYWLTLSAHLPVENPGKSGSMECSGYKELAEDPELCKLVLQQRKLFSEIASSISSGELSDSRIVLVGDHSPPFLDNNARALFSSEHVPYIDIKIPGDL